MPEETKKVFEQKDIDDNKLVAAISYLWVLCLIPLLFKKSSPFASAHAKQGLILFVIELVGSLFFWIPIIGWLFWLLLVVVSLLAFFKTLQGEYWAIPIVSDIVKKIKL